MIFKILSWSHPRLLCIHLALDPPVSRVVPPSLSFVVPGLSVPRTSSLVVSSVSSSFTSPAVVSSMLLTYATPRSPLVSSWSSVSLPVVPSASPGSFRPSSLAFLPSVPAVSWPPSLAASTTCPVSSWLGYSMTQPFVPVPSSAGFTSPPFSLPAPSVYSAQLFSQAQVQAQTQARAQAPLRYAPLPMLSYPAAGVVDGRWSVWGLISVRGFVFAASGRYWYEPVAPTWGTAA